uniref:Fukutin n=1 Tax=Ditylenchus dipsaci TaxID=166011 RepID=A0A915CVZ3_9BILA
MKRSVPALFQHLFIIVKWLLFLIVSVPLFFYVWKCNFKESNAVLEDLTTDVYFDQNISIALLDGQVEQKAAADTIRHILVDQDCLSALLEKGTKSCNLSVVVATNQKKFLTKDADTLSMYKFIYFKEDNESKTVFINKDDGEVLALRSFATVPVYSSHIFNEELSKTVELKLEVPVDIPSFLREYKASHFLECKPTMSEDQMEARAAKANHKRKIPTNFSKKIAELLLILSYYSITGFLFNGSLLGWRRECSIIPHTKDVDIAIFAHQHSSALIADLRAGALPGYTLKEILGSIEDSLELKLKIDGVNVDVFYVYEETNRNVSYTAGFNSNNRKQLMWVYPKFRKVCSGLLHDQFVHLPCEVDSILEADYGPDWREDVDTSKFNCGVMKLIYFLFSLLLLVVLFVSQNLAISKQEWETPKFDQSSFKRREECRIFCDKYDEAHRHDKPETVQQRNEDRNKLDNLSITIRQFHFIINNLFKEKPLRKIKYLSIHFSKSIRVWFSHSGNIYGKYYALNTMLPYLSSKTNFVVSSHLTVFGNFYFPNASQLQLLAHLWKNSALAVQFDKDLLPRSSFEELFGQLFFSKILPENYSSEEEEEGWLVQLVRSFFKRFKQAKTAYAYQFILDCASDVVFANFKVTNEITDEELVFEEINDSYTIKRSKINYEKVTF